ncbi:hypothetical protein [Natronorubrum daqingense]|uniref:Uncharacterized protein n=1 Tax=Natronorubrum daqingense TaxID=588898 RepID=A0A1N7G4L7_9EURY|nr:hypothetical protein [Natronorubrum daqingense]APX98738.1 hypothetical protein BB347_18710 [Natronorubrum daqingense]SIS07488.1 hypothetical protein SAMN05421809_3715 [Natronorubrum daqingense]
MALTQTHTIGHSAREHTTVDLGEIVADVPPGTTCDLAVAGDRSSYELEFTRRETRWTVEGAGDVAELTAVYAVGGDQVGKPERVPGWIRAVCAELEIREVSMR